MKRKYILMFMYLLTSVCIFSIGFSSWTIVQNATIDTSGNIIAEDIVSINNYIKLTNQTNLRYYKTGFVTADNQVSKTGYMTVEYEIDVVNCKVLYEEYSSLNVIVYLDTINYNIFDDTSVSFELVDSNDQVIHVNSSSLNDSKHQVEFSLNNVLSEDYSSTTYSFEITYYFTVDTYETYETNIYPNIAKVKFNTSAFAGGVE